MKRMVGTWRVATKNSLHNQVYIVHTDMHKVYIYIGVGDQHQAWWLRCGELN